MQIAIDPELLSLAPGLRLGALVLSGLRPQPAVEALAAWIGEVTAAVRARLPLAQVAQVPGVAGWRQVLRALGTDPTRYRVASERLLRRVCKGEPLPAVCDLVDVANAWSVRTGLPVGLYDLAHVQGPVTLGAGRPGERYRTLAGTDLETAGKPVLRDVAGPLGGPLTDGERAMITPACREALFLAYVPPGFPDGDLAAVLDEAAGLLARFAGAQVLDRQVVGDG